MAELKPYQVADETFIIPSTHPVPGHGVLHMNSMIIRSQEPVIIDTGMPVRRKEWLEMAFSLVNPSDVRWIFISHDDRDHSGNLMQVLEMCPNATVLAHFMLVGRLAEEYDLPLARIRFVNDGESFSAGDRTLVAIRPPVFDSPGTRGVWDAKTSVYYCVDAFGATVPDHVESVADVPSQVYDDGFFWFNRANHVWHELVDPAKFDLHVEKIRQLQPAVIAGSHGPTAYGRTDQLCDMMKRIGRMPAAADVTQAQLEALLGGASAQ